MNTIKQIKARQIIDSRGNPTVQADVITNEGYVGRANVPSGASTGSREALELRDQDQSKYLGKGVQKVVNNINELLNEELKGMSVVEQRRIDEKMLQLDGTENKSNLGANALLAVSLATARVASKVKKIELFEHLRELHSFQLTDYILPVPMLNIINGGAHANNSIDFQEFMIQPLNFDSIHEAVRASAEVFHNLKKIIDSQNMVTSVGDEGGFAPNMQNSESTLKIIEQAILKSGYSVNDDFVYALDCAASEFYNKETQQYQLSGEKLTLNSEQMVDYLEDLTSKYPIKSIEDGLDEGDWQGWKILTQTLSQKVQLVGDDLFVTNSKILQQGIDQKIGNAILIKFNQIGTLTETLDCIQLAQKNNYNVIISHRSGETADTFIADLAVATNAKQIKTGSLSRSDRVEKYNRLMLIEEYLKENKKQHYYANQSIYKSN